MSQTKISTTVSMKLDEPMEKFYSKLLEFVEQSIENDEWDADDFKACFVQNMPVKTTKTTNKTKTVKDPSKPKRARGAYIYFSSDKEVREQIKKDNPEAKSSDIMKLIGSLWSSDKYKNHHDEGEHKDKKGPFDYQPAADKYLRKAAKDKDRYAQEMSGYTPDPSFAKPVKAKTVKEKPAPKRARTAYMFFCMEKRGDAKKELGSILTGRELNTEVTKLLGEWWTEHKVYNDDGEHKDKKGKFDYTEDAQKYLDMAEDDKKRVNSLKSETEHDDSTDTVSKKSSDDVEALYEYFYGFQTANGYGPNYTKEKRDYKIRKAWDKMTIEQKLEWEESDGEVEESDDEFEESDDEVEESDDEVEDDHCCGCDFVYSRRNAKENKNKGDSCGHETVGDSGRCAKHKNK